MPTTRIDHSEVQQQLSVCFLPGLSGSSSNRKEHTLIVNFLSYALSRQAMLTSGAWYVNHYDLSYHGQPAATWKTYKPSGCCKGKAQPQNLHKPLTSSMLEMPRSLMSTSGWFFSRLSSTNFFRDLDIFCTKRQQQSTWATAREVQR